MLGIGNIWAHIYELSMTMSDFYSQPVNTSTAATSDDGWKVQTEKETLKKI